MSTVIDIRSAKRRHEDHVAEHKCTAGQQCPVRLSTWRAYMRQAHLWGSEPGDTERYRRQTAKA